MLAAILSFSFLIPYEDVEKRQLGIVAQDCNLSIWEAEAGGPRD
jgi:hypothetical protein